MGLRAGTGQLLVTVTFNSDKPGAVLEGLEAAAANGTLAAALNKTGVWLAPQSKGGEGGALPRVALAPTAEGQGSNSSAGGTAAAVALCMVGGGVMGIVAGAMFMVSCWPSGWSMAHCLTLMPTGWHSYWPVIPVKPTSCAKM